MKYMFKNLYHIKGEIIKSKVRLSALNDNIISWDIG
jgi:hypothetical protein